MIGLADSSESGGSDEASREQSIEESDSTASSDGGGFGGLLISTDDLVAFACGDMQGRLNDSIYNLIQTESERVGSPVQKWLQEFRAKCRDPLNADWRRITAPGIEDDRCDDKS